MKMLLTLLLLAVPFTLAGSVAAQTIPIKPGQSVAVDGFGLERNGETGIATLVLKLIPDYEPEPFGPVPPADVARVHEALCNAIAPRNADLMAEHGATRFAVRWDWTPAQQDGDFTISRSHRNDFAVSAEGDCTRIWFVAEEYPTLLSGATPRLLYAETITDQRMDGLGLEMSYAWGTPLIDADRPARARAALELCLTALEDEMRRRHDNYRDLRYDFLAVTFEEYPAPGARNRDSHVYILDGGHCITDLSQDKVDAIRAVAQ